MDITINCGDYEISDGAKGAQLVPFIKTKLYKLGYQIVGERVNREITNFNNLRWRATKVAKKW